MRAVIQRVAEAEVQVGGRTVGKIDRGILTFLGVGAGDSKATVEKLIQKILRLRIFEDESAKMNLSLQEIQGGHLIVSQFTLYADLSKGNRPSFIDAAKPDVAREIYNHALEFSSAQGVLTQAGEFQADMQVRLVNDGPATLILVQDGGIE
ncbi:MAG: hypothetical protein RJB38_533 [Pseudomonadota bacterium]